MNRDFRNLKRGLIFKAPLSPAPVKSNIRKYRIYHRRVRYLKRKMRFWQRRRFYRSNNTVANTTLTKVFVNTTSILRSVVVLACGVSQIVGNNFAQKSCVRFLKHHCSQVAAYYNRTLIKKHTRYAYTLMHSIRHNKI